MRLSKSKSTKGIFQKKKKKSQQKGAFFLILLLFFSLRDKNELFIYLFIFPMGVFFGLKHILPWNCLFHTELLIFKIEKLKGKKIPLKKGIYRTLFVNKLQIQGYLDKFSWSINSKYYKENWPLVLLVIKIWVGQCILYIQLLRK